MNVREEIRYLILALQREGNRQLTSVLRPLDLTPSQAEVLQVLHEYAPLTLLQLGERLVCETGSPSRLVKSMVEAGWVEKQTNPDDGRAVLLVLTPKAQAIMPTLNQVEQIFNADVAPHTDTATLTAFAESLWLLARDTESGQALLRRKQHQ